MRRNKIMRTMAKRFLAALLVCSVSLSSSVQALASSTESSSSPRVMSGEAFREEMEEARRKASPLYDQLVRTNGSPEKPVTSVSEEGEDWAADFWLEAAGAGVDEALNQLGQKAGDKVKHLFRGSSSYYQTKGVLSLVSETIDKAGSILGVANAVSKFNDVLNLQGDTVEAQLMELAVLTAQFGMAAFSVIGMSIGFPWGLLLSIALTLLLELIRNGEPGFPSRGDDYRDRTYHERYKLPDDATVYKPNIYIYSEEEREVTVTFGEPELLTSVIPEYPGSWKVTADANGNLTDETGEVYEYLFYESTTQASLFETEAGWRIPADTRQERLEEILSGLGFSERETKDFTDFWTEKLEPDTEYVMYPQGTDLVDLAMPITIEEKPECIERIWFVFMKEAGQRVEEPEGYELTRGGEDCSCYVLEWGGLILSGER